MKKRFGHRLAEQMAAKRTIPSSMIVSGTVSRHLQFRAAGSTPTVRIPASSSDTANSRRSAKPPPVVTGRTAGVPVNSSKGAEETTTTGRVPCCSWPATGSRPTSRIPPRCAAPARCRPDRPQADRDPVVSRRGLVALRREFVESAAGTHSRCHDRAASPNPDIDPGTLPNRLDVKSSAGGTAIMTESPTLHGLAACLDFSGIVS